MKKSRWLSGASESKVMTGIPAAMALLISGPISFGSATDTRIPAGFLAIAARNSSTSMVGVKVSGLRCGAGESGVCGLPIRQTDVGGDEKVLLRFAMALASSNKDGKSRGQYHQENTLFQHFHNHLQRSRGPNSTPKT